VGSTSEAFRATIGEIFASRKNRVKLRGNACVRVKQLSYKLRLRATHLLGFKKSSRSKIRDRVSKLCSIRSKIVHCGSNKLSQSDLEELRIITQSCIIRLLSGPIFRDFSKEEDLENWFEEMIIFGPELPTVQNG
jgi:hypothetical protein